MCLFNKSLRRENTFLHATIERLNRLVDELQKELTIKKNIAERDANLIEKLRKRIKTQQQIIEKQNEQLGFTKTKKQ